MLPPESEEHWQHQLEGAEVEVVAELKQPEVGVEVVEEELKQQEVEVEEAVVGELKQQEVEVEVEVEAAEAEAEKKRVGVMQIRLEVAVVEKTQLGAGKMPLGMKIELVVLKLRMGQLSLLMTISITDALTSWWD
jgi:hypothetical protein